MAKFIKNKEDFICEKCGLTVKGSGYTNHCSHCLWSKHVDLNPGDRASTCGGLMEPIAVEGIVDRYILVHRCVKCGFKKKNKVSPKDDGSTLAQIALIRASKEGMGK